MINRFLTAVGLALSVAISVGLSSTPANAKGAQTNDYSAFRTENPRSILIVPVLNNTVNVRAPDFFLSTISQPFGNRGYYVFPAYMVKRMLEEDGLADPGLVHAADPRRLETLFGCDAVLYVTIERWEAKYLVLATQTDVKFTYTLKSCKTGAALWSHTEERVYVPQSSSSGNLVASLVAKAVVAAIEKGAPNYMPLTTQANAAAAGWPGHGIPAGPYLPELFQKDQAQFPGEIKPVTAPAGN